MLAVCGLASGEVFGVWYDSTHSEAELAQTRAGVMIAEAVNSVPQRPLAFGYAKQYFREVVGTPDAFEHYHWGLWLLANAVTAFPYSYAFAFTLVGLAVSLVLDENRGGLAGHPFGVSKPFFAATAAVGILLVGTLILRVVSIGSPFELWASTIAFIAPFVPLSLFWLNQLMSR